MNVFQYDFGYEWPWIWGHAIGAIVFAVLCISLWFLARRRLSILAGALCAWALAGAVIVNVLFAFSRPIPLPTERFLEAGRGRVLDAGAGSGRSTLMVLLARPEARVTALDIFGAEYGIGGNTPERLRSNVRAAGAEARLDVQVGDMRAMPFAPATFDAAVSAFAIDHLSRRDVERTFVEMARVIKPGGDFLLLVINQDGWIRTAFPFLAHHGYFGGRSNPDRWRALLADARFDVVEQGTTPGTLYLLARTRR